MTENPVIKLFLGEKEHTVDPKDVTPETSLNSYLREVVHLTATKRSCLEGGCGACIVAVEHTDPVTKIKKVFAVNSCLVSIFSCHSWKIHTSEGIGNPLIGYHPLQEKLAEENGSQCGFCSSGMIMNMYALIESGKVTAEQVENSFAGNICRCTGYRPILETWKSFASNDIEDYHPCNLKCEQECAKTCEKLQPLIYNYGKSSWIKFYILNDLLQTLETVAKSYMLVAGNTAQGVYKHDPPNVYMDVTSVKELTTWRVTSNALILGGNITLNHTMDIFKSVSKDNSKLAYLSKLADHLDLVANIPVRNIGTLAGNLMLKHQHPEFQSDVFLILETVNATLLIVDSSEHETRTSPEEFIKINMNRKVIKYIILKPYDETYIYRSYKIMSRAQNTAATVNAGFLFQMKKDVVLNCRIVFGAINPTFVHAKNTEKYLKNKHLYDNSVLQEAYKLLNDEIKPDYILPEAKPEYRKNLAISLFYKFVLNTAPADKISARNKSGAQLLERPLSSGSQEYSTQKYRYPVSKPIVKLEALAQTTGQAEYIEDIPDQPNQLFCSFVLANAAPNSVITNIDTVKALKVPGVITFFGKDDIPGNNVWTPTESSIFFVEEVLFCTGTVQYYDQPVGIIVAKSQEIAETASDLVVVTCTPAKETPLLNIRDVLKAPDDIQKARITPKMNLDPKRKGTDIKKVVNGDFFIGLQYHFHMELQCCNVVPIEDGLDVFTATQWMDCNQIAIAALLNLKNTQINIRVRRLGGAFGGKIMRSAMVSNAAALAAFKLNKPVKMRLPLVKNMKIMGKRYPLYVKYEAGVNDKGIIQFLDAKLYSDYGVGGNEPMDSMLFSMFQNGYNVDTWKLSSYRVKTDVHPNSFTRAPGTKTGLCAIESVMEHIAYSLGIDAYEMKLANTNKEKHQKIFDFSSDLMSWADIPKRKQAFEEFNKANRWRKKGMSIIPMSWILEVHAAFTSLVSVFHADGSVAISHGGIEMGQGINTKVAQVAAYKLGIPLDLIQIKPSSNLCSPSSSTTGGSITTEAVCYATLRACDIILERMEPIKKTMSNPTWQEVVKKCFDNFIILTATSDFSPSKPNIKEYFIYGLCASEVEVDILTGKYQINRVDIIEDVGDSMNPTLDIGQVEGAFVMGIGYFTTEEIIFSEEGEILTNRTWNYKPPGPKDIPIQFNIKFPAKIPNHVGVLNSKATAEPPTCLSATIPLAIRNAVASARNDADPSKPKWYPIDGCSTIENTFLNSLNDFNQYTL